MVSYRQWKIINESLGSFSLGVKSPKSVGVMGSKLPKDMPMGGMGDEAQDEMGDDVPMGGMGDEAQDEMGDDVPMDGMGDEMNAPVVAPEDEMDNPDFMDADYMDDDAMMNMQAMPKPTPPPMGDDMAGMDGMGDENGDEMDDLGDMPQDDMDDDMGDEIDDMDAVPGEEGDAMGAEKPLMTAKPPMKKPQPPMLNKEENEFLSKLISNGRGTVRQKFNSGLSLKMEDALIGTTKATAKKEPVAGEVGFAPQGKLGATQSFAEWRKAKEAK